MEDKKNPEPEQNQKNEIAEEKLDNDSPNENKKEEKMEEKQEEGELIENKTDKENNNLENENDMKLTYEEKLNFKFLRLNNLLERRPLMLCLTKLRQNPNNVKEWIQKISLCKNYDSIIETYEEAINTIIPEKAFGNLSELYINYANYYEQYNEIIRLLKVNKKY